MTTNTGRKDALGRTVYRGPKGGLYILTASGKRGSPAVGGKPATARKPAAAKAKGECPRDKIMNPATRRCISRTGPTGQRLVSRNKERRRFINLTDPANRAKMERILRLRDASLVPLPGTRNSLPMPRRQPKTAKNAYDNGMRVARLSNTFTTEAGLRKVRKYQDYVYDHWNRDKVESFDNGLHAGFRA